MSEEPQPELTSATPAAQLPAAPAPAVIHVDGLRETLASLCETLVIVRAELEHHGKSIKFNWISSRLMMLRNVVVAFAVVSATIIGVTLLVREAYRQTLTIVAFDVPKSVSDRGITGEVVAKNLFNELVKRRRTITTFDAGELTRLSAERHSDIASTDGKFSLQAVFRYLRHLTGRETTIDGEMLVDGDNITLIARVAGHPQRSVKGPLAEWDKLLSELANDVFEATQPVVLVGYLGEIARTPADLEALSRLVQKMATVKPPFPMRLWPWPTIPTAWS